MKEFLNALPRFLFFTGKGGVGKTSMACAVALGLADKGRKVLLISTDPASNLDEVLETPLSSRPTPLRTVPNLEALNINPIEAAAEYRERVVGPYRGVLPEAAVARIEEQLSGACTVEIAGFNEFSKRIGDDDEVRTYDHIVLDTAPTGHTLRLLSLPSAWNDFIAENTTGSSCLGPVAGLKEQKQLFERVLAALKDPEKTLFILVSRAENIALAEASRAAEELAALGLTNRYLIINGLFSSISDDAVARAFLEKSRAALEAIPRTLAALPTTTVPFRPSGVMGVQALRAVLEADAGVRDADDTDGLEEALSPVLARTTSWPAFITSLEKEGHGVVMTLGKGGVGKTSMAAMIAAQLVQRGHIVRLSTTDPAAHVSEIIGEGLPNLKVERIDPKTETSRYVAVVLEQNRPVLSDDDLALLAEELRSPCIEEIAVFQAFARTVARGEKEFVVLDTAPTGHTLLLLDATQSYHREVAKSSGDLPVEVAELLPRLRNPAFVKIVVVALPEATPVHEASALQDELRRAGIEPHGWVLNRVFALSGTRDPVLRAKGLDEIAYIEEVVERYASRVALSPWIAEELKGSRNLRGLMGENP